MANITSRDTAYKLKLKIVLTPSFMFSDNTLITYFELPRCPIESQIIRCELHLIYYEI